MDVVTGVLPSLVVAYDQRRWTARDLKVLVRKIEHANPVIIVVAHLERRRVEYYGRCDRGDRDASRKGCRAGRGSAGNGTGQGEGRRRGDCLGRVQGIARSVKEHRIRIGSPVPGEAHRSAGGSRDLELCGPVRADVRRAGDAGRRQRLHRYRRLEVQRAGAWHRSARAYAEQPVGLPCRKVSCRKACASSGIQGKRRSRPRAYGIGDRAVGRPREYDGRARALAYRRVCSRDGARRKRGHSDVYEVSKDCRAWYRTGRGHASKGISGVGRKDLGDGGLPDGRVCRARGRQPYRLRAPAVYRIGNIRVERAREADRSAAPFADDR
ncbi:hypothetical protein D9M72_283400 [compost metagenome]